MAKFIQGIIDEIIDQYLYADETNRPWIIGFSGGKDSTVMLQLVWKAIEQIKQKNPLIYQFEILQHTHYLQYDPNIFHDQKFLDSIYIFYVPILFYN